MGCPPSPRLCPEWRDWLALSTQWRSPHGRDRRMESLAAQDAGPTPSSPPAPRPDPALLSPASGSGARRTGAVRTGDTGRQGHQASCPGGPPTQPAMPTASKHKPFPRGRASRHKVTADCGPAPAAGPGRSSRHTVPRNSPVLRNTHGKGDAAAETSHPARDASTPAPRPSDGARHAALTRFNAMLRAESPPSPLDDAQMERRSQTRALVL